MEHSNNSTACDRMWTIREVQPDPAVDLLHFQVICLIPYCCVMIMGLVGNALVIYCSFLTDVNFSVRKIFIVGLALSDIFISITCLPITAVSIFTREWLFGRITCKSIGLIQGTCIFVSSLTLAVIAIDRFVLITKPLRFNLKYYQAVCIMFFIITFSVLVSSPLAFFQVLESHKCIVGVFCGERWPSHNVRLVYGLLTVCFQYGLPLMITSYCYWRIRKQVEQQIQRRRVNEILLARTERNLLQKRRKTNRMTLTMVLSFMLAWLPLNLLNLYRDLIGMFPYFSIAFAAAHVIAMTSVIWNPLIYSWFNESFRHIVHQVLPCTRRARPDGYEITPVDINNGIPQAHSHL